MVNSVVKTSAANENGIENDSRRIYKNVGWFKLYNQIRNFTNGRKGNMLIPCIEL